MVTVLLWHSWRIPLKLRCDSYWKWFSSHGPPVGKKNRTMFSRMPTWLKYLHMSVFVPKKEAYKALLWKLVPMCLVLSTPDFFFPPHSDIPAPWPTSWQVQSRHGQLECRCSTLEQPPQRCVSGGDGRIPARHWRTWWHFCHKYCGEVLCHEWFKRALNTVNSQRVSLWVFLRKKKSLLCSRCYHKVVQQESFIWVG